MGKNNMVEKLDKILGLVEEVRQGNKEIRNDLNDFKNDQIEYKKYMQDMIDLLKQNQKTLDKHGEILNSMIKNNESYKNTLVEFKPYVKKVNRNG